MTFANNYISTTKYNVFNFLPVCLLMQFTRVSNLYFLIVTILQCIPAISPLKAYTAIVPLTFVICVGMVREAVEDFIRYKQDKISNSQPVLVRFLPDARQGRPVKSGDEQSFKKQESKLLRVGDLVKIYEDELFPADLVLVATSSPERICFVQTGSLDGEKSLKKKWIPRLIHEVVPQTGRPFEFTGQCEADAPGRDLEKFHGLIKFNDRKFTLGNHQLLLKGAQLKNTKWVIGFVVYTGEDTKIMMNTTFKTARKFAKFDAQLSLFVVYMFLLQVFICVLVAIMSRQIGNSVDNKFDVGFPEYLPEGLFTINQAFKTFFTYFLLMATLIPISLFVSIECKRFIISRWMEYDTDIYSLIWDRPAKVANSSVTTDLG